MGISVIGTNKRYGFRLDEQTLERMQGQEPPPATLPPAAWGKRQIDWTQARPPVWVWVSWSGRPAERRKGYVKGHNDRVCIVWVDGDGGGWEIVVWRNAVTMRR